ncbi:MAG TPA: hypothetical protein VIK18_26945 [Pirellulales bacterium]
MERSEPDHSYPASQEPLLALEARIHAILPPRYVGCFEEVSPASMGSAELKYDAQGRVAWGAIWTTFCHLALAGGPPHRGRLLEPVSVAEAEASPGEQAQVVAEIERALLLTTELPVSPSPRPGWVGIRCHDDDMAGWLVRAIVAENVIARRQQEVLFVPAGPAFRVEQEIKNVVVSVAKACHYLLDHVEPDQRPSGLAGRLVEPPLPSEVLASPGKYLKAARELEQCIRRDTGLNTILGQTQGWIGVDCSSEEMAVWMLRAVVVEDILARCEGNRLCVPIDMSDSPLQPIAKTADAVAQAYRLWKLHAAR